MRKILVVLLILGSLFTILVKSALAQEPYFPFIDSFTTVVGTGGAGTNPGPDPTIPPGDGDPIGPVPGCTEIWDRMNSDFGASVYLENSDTRYAVCEHLQSIYQTYQVASQSQKYYSILKQTGPFKIRLYPSGECFGNAYSAHTAKLFGSGCITSRYLVLHETGHLMRMATQPKIMPGTAYQQLLASDPSCYDQGFLKTYGLRSTIRISETSAEAIALYVLGGRRTIRDFKSECPNTYNYMKTAVFGEYEFN